METPQLNVLWPVTQYGLSRFGFAVPDDVASFTSARLVFVLTASSAGTYHLFLEVKRDGEPVSLNDIAIQLNVAFSLNGDQIQEIDITSVFDGELDVSSGGNDYASLLVYVSGAPIATARILGMRFIYEPLPVNGEGLADDAVTSAEVADNSITGIDIQNGTITSVDLGPSSVTGAAILPGSVASVHIIDGTVGSADVNPNQIQRRVFQSCGTGQAIRTIDVNGNVVCQPTADIGRSLTRFSNFTIVAGGIATRTLTCPGSKVVVSGGQVKVSGNAEPNVAASGPLSDFQWQERIDNDNFLDSALYFDSISQLARRSFLTSAR